MSTCVRPGHGNTLDSPRRPRYISSPTTRRRRLLRLTDERFLIEPGEGGVEFILQRGVEFAQIRPTAGQIIERPARLRVAPRRARSALARRAIAPVPAPRIAGLGRGLLLL